MKRQKFLFGIGILLLLLSCMYAQDNPATAWKVEDGALVSPGHGPELIKHVEIWRFQIAYRVQLRTGREQRNLFARPIRSSGRR
jgi:hypothetical protein